MRKSLLISAIVLCLAGCASNSPYGNYSAAPAAYDRAMATDTVSHLVSMYPPAHTRWNIMQPSEDPYGKALVELLRGRGYSVSEYTPTGKGQSQAAAPNPASTGIPLHYLVDSLSPAADLYRVTVVVAGQPISRAYIQQKNGTVVAAGSWSRKE